MNTVEIVFIFKEWSEYILSPNLTRKSCSKKKVYEVYQIESSCPTKTNKKSKTQTMKINPYPKNQNWKKNIWKTYIRIIVSFFCSLIEDHRATKSN